MPKYETLVTAAKIGLTAQTEARLGHRISVGFDRGERTWQKKRVGFLRRQAYRGSSLASTSERPAPNQHLVLGSQPEAKANGSRR